jgi:hypothetical protein
MQLILSVFSDDSTGWPVTVAVQKIGLPEFYFAKVMHFAFVTARIFHTHRSRVNIFQLVRLHDLTMR